jgi:hypothetical protein
MALGDYSQFVDLSNPLLDCFIFDPADGLQPSITRLLAGLGYRVECVEPTATMIEVASQNIGEFLRLDDMEALIPSVQFHQTTLEECNLPDEIAEGLLFYESFHHLIDGTLAAKQAFLCPKPDGLAAG